MRFTCFGNRSQMMAAIALAAAVAAVPARATDGDNSFLVLAKETISEDVQQNTDMSPSYSPTDAAAAAAAQDPAFAARRAKMIQDCENNNGVDCKKQVDTELGAELLQEGGVKHLAPERH